MLKRLRTVRERTKEGLFGSVPYSFMSSALRARYTVLFGLLWLVHVFSFLNVLEY